MSTNLTPPIGVRIPSDLRQHIELKAKENFRSVSAEVWMRLERTRQDDIQLQERHKAGEAKHEKQA